ncbi:MAG: hypothetical protein A3G33_01470 [Omnitrophica bacterium RIFCSPLOWO2_12_FULL_44_17]|uniref:Uncharacterized protein n=1 Tax=Candidatus Danuiimicrobium aquiferis TaxID=1801832 RepID=A0A1G1KV83_9BACT|nr:MAG: hypothetical protein A3B72_00700 [Omnitrophica bacterium RIFCSPHIGHO2_02_FULL_45_28]OGW88676.1 MAG: hypothetical protein A3E74_00865 [Omnitrophica bacterium RIFCSPHIGHO2_12_FULL_44_12]OGW96785.1 MAG: hypothetical protein A3G33_01470 [Omnitrophica bacterium RIFCSPLOWO2_12_FULL_44_17]OGX03787.1 MAG: hypothetical protein A3J12_09355 [Omnitrophica bacterium RIFCSPLOWO2_02_FULL_44_11]
MFKTIFYLVLSLLIVALLVTLAYFGYQWHQERKVLQQIVERLSADSRIAEVLVTKSRYNEASGKLETTIKFLEYDASGKPLEPRYFTFQGNIIQFQSLVIRFKDEFVNAGDSLRGKSIYLFLRAFVLDEKNAQVFNITEMNGIPKGYKIPNVKSDFERKLWEEFWTLALDPKAREREGIKNAQIEAPGSIFLPGTIYTLQIEHDGGIRIDTEPVPEILKDELQK